MFKNWRLNPVGRFVCKYFSPFCGLSFHFVMVVFAAQKLLCLIRSHLLTFVFIFIILGGESKKILLGFMSESVLPLFSSKSFIKNRNRATGVENKLRYQGGEGG